MNPKNLSQRLEAGLRSDQILTELPDRQHYSSDWTKTPGNADVVVFPKTREEVSFVLRLCSELNVPVTPSGGRTGLAGGAVAQGGVALSLARMNRILPVDIRTQSVRVQAGAITQGVHEVCHAVGLTWPVDLASKGSCTVGGNLSTNAGGVRVVRYGMARRWVRSLEAVLISGEILDLNRTVQKNNTGYDLVQLLVGSEGTLAVITEATLKLAPLSQNTDVCLFGVKRFDSIDRILYLAQKTSLCLNAYEFFSAACLDAVESHLKITSGLPKSAFYVLIDCDEDSSAFERFLASVYEENLATDGRRASSGEEKRHLWSLREGITESLSHLGSVRKYDLSLPIETMPHFIADVEKAVARKAATPYFFGHYADGSPHLNLLQPQGTSESAFDEAVKSLEPTLYELIQRAGGSVSAEHGVGLLKTSWMRSYKPRRELQLMRGIKAAFDPKGLLNPGKVIPE